MLEEQGKLHFKTGTAKHKFNLWVWQVEDEAKVSFKNGHLYAVVKRMKSPNLKIVCVQYRNRSLINFSELSVSVACYEKGSLMRMHAVKLSRG